MQIKTTMRLLYIARILLSVGENAEKLETLYVASGNVMVQLLGKRVWQTLKS
jgi:hypothetical protein